MLVQVERCVLISVTTFQHMGILKKPFYVVLFSNFEAQFEISHSNSSSRETVHEIWIKSVLFNIFFLFFNCTLKFKVCNFIMYFFGKSFNSVSDMAY
jgi:hypothetical protein